MDQQLISRAGLFIKPDIGRAVVAGLRITSHCNHPSRNSLRNFPVIADIAVDNQDAILWKQLCEPAKRPADVLDIFKKVQMVRFNV